MVLKNDVTDSKDDVCQALQKLVRKHIGGFAIPNTFLVSLHFTKLTHLYICVPEGGGLIKLQHPE